eukprot:TRINITY_DN17528_c0_g1_i1.p1 TRINITY_DN17528_c0_g1~~TRINITY_DN17528_c0_g1_i1.p1  ORF type:complete len:262 (-),score=41.65 TRINITY_DN17528_c0_g1_i1:212-997(-)
MFSTCKKEGLDGVHEDTEPEAEAAKCNRAWHDWVAGMKESESTATKYLTFILGFYVGQMIKRWWDQVKSLPDIDSITNCLAGFVQLEFGDDQKTQDSALRLKKKIVRYCLLSWTMCLSAISPPLHDKFSSGEKYIQKGLMRKGEMKALQGDRPACWKDQWWIPITWAICLVNSNHPESQGCKLKEQKDIIEQSSSSDLWTGTDFGNLLVDHPRHIRFSVSRHPTQRECHLLLHPVVSDCKNHPHLRLDEGGQHCQESLWLG